MTNRYHFVNRTLLDDKRKIIDFEDSEIEPPLVGIFDEPTVLRKPLNQQWDAIITGAIHTLLTVLPGWYLAEDEDYPGIQAVLQWLISRHVCTIYDVLADEIFFQEEYLPTVLGDYFTVTNEHNEELNTTYDGTPQSIGVDIPPGVPDDKSKNALCYALLSFVRLYASSKLCVIQSKNFIEIAWNELQNAVNAVYNALTDSLAFIYTPNLFSCFVDDNEAIDVLQDTAAMEELGCFLYEELKTVTISQSNFENALLSAATTLTGNAGKLACIMQNDSNLTVYINFLEAYQIALNRINSGESLDCPCETGNYRVITYDFSQGFLAWRPDYVINTSTRYGTPQSDGIAGVQSSANVQGVSMFLDGHDPAWRVHGYNVEFSRTGAGNTSNDLGRLFFRPNPASTVGQSNLNPSNGSAPGSHIFAYTNLAVNTYQTNFRQIWVNFQCNSPGSENIIVHKISIWYMDGFAPGGYLTNDEPIP